MRNNWQRSVSMFKGTCPLESDLARIRESYFQGLVDLRGYFGKFCSPIDVDQTKLSKPCPLHSCTCEENGPSLLEPTKNLWFYEPFVNLFFTKYGKILQLWKQVVRGHKLLSGPKIVLRNTQMHDAISIHERVIVTLRFFCIRYICKSIM